AREAWGNRREGSSLPGGGGRLRWGGQAPPLGRHGLHRAADVGIADQGRLGRVAGERLPAGLGDDVFQELGVVVAAAGVALRGPVLEGVDRGAPILAVSCDRIDRLPCPKPPAST